MGLAEAQATAKTALEALQDRRGDVERLDSDLGACRDALEALEAREAVTPEDLVAQENERRRLRRLEAQRADAQTALREAQAHLREANLDRDRARLQDLRSQITEDAIAVAKFVEETLVRLTECFSAHEERIAEATKLHRSIRMAEGTADAFENFTTHAWGSPWASVNPQDPWSAIPGVLADVRRARKARAAAEARAEAERGKPVPTLEEQEMERRRQLDAFHGGPPVNGWGPLESAQGPKE